MDHRAAIPALALLGLSFTDCTGHGEQPTIVGDWRAVEIDGEALPWVEADGPIAVRSGFEMVIDDDLTGELSYYEEFEDGPLSHHSEQGGDLLVDDAGAPDIKIVVDDFYGFHYEDDSSSGSDGAPLHADLARPIAAAPAPAGAFPTFTLACTLDGDLLTCDREGAGAGDDFKRWVFRRHEPTDE
jgi:hypothetical protein